MKILAIDPASKITGYAVLTGLDPADLIDCGLLKGKEMPFPAALVEMWPHLAGKELTAWRRIRSIAADVDRLVSEFRPDWLIVEVASGLIGTGAKHRARGSLTTYGQAVGYLARSMAADRVVPCTERRWIGLGNPKRSRMKVIAAIYPDRDWEKQDPGGDARDAIAMGRWALFRARPAQARSGSSRYPRTPAAGTP